MAIREGKDELGFISRLFFNSVEDYNEYCGIYELPCECRRDVFGIYMGSRKDWLQHKVDEIHKVDYKDGCIITRQECGRDLAIKGWEWTYFCEECCQEFSYVVKMRSASEQLRSTIDEPTLRDEREQ